MDPKTGSTFTLSANTTQGNYSSVVFGQNGDTLGTVTYSNGFTWNVNQPTAGGGNTTLPVNVDADDALFELDGTLNLNNGSSAQFGNSSMSGATLTVGATGAFNVTGSTFGAESLNNQGTLSLAGGTGTVVGNITNSNTLKVSGGATFQQTQTASTTTNKGSIAVSGSGSWAVLHNVSGTGSFSVTDNDQLALDTFNSSLANQVSCDSTGAVQIGGTITTPANGTFDFTQLGSHVTFGITHGDEAYDNGTVSFNGGTILHSDQLANVANLTNVTLDHGLTLTNGPLSQTTGITGTVNAGDQPITLPENTRLVLNPNSTLNGNVVIAPDPDQGGSATFVLGGNLNGNITNNGSGNLQLGAAAQAVCTITNNGTLSGTAENGVLLAGSNFELWCHVKAGNQQFHV